MEKHSMNTRILNNHLKHKDSYLLLKITYTTILSTTITLEEEIITSYWYLEPY